MEVSNWINEFDQRNVVDSITRAKVEGLGLGTLTLTLTLALTLTPNPEPLPRAKVEGLLFEASHKFLVNKQLSVRSRTFEIIRDLNADPAYHQYLLMCKVRVRVRVRIRVRPRVPPVPPHVQGNPYPSPHVQGLTPSPSPQSQTP